MIFQILKAAAIAMMSSHTRGTCAPSNTSVIYNVLPYLCIMLEESLNSSQDTLPTTIDNNYKAQHLEYHLFCDCNDDHPTFPHVCFLVLRYIHPSLHGTSKDRTSLPIFLSGFSWNKVENGSNLILMWDHSFWTKAPTKISN